jgi:signal transduction histidine kinase
VDNAVKYSPDGGEVRLALRQEGEGVLLRVQDEGIGLPPGAAAAIFEPFGRADNAERRHLPGLGLGLHICRGIIERHGGRIWAESAGEGRGTTVSIWLPDRGERERG